MTSHERMYRALTAITEIRPPRIVDAGTFDKFQGMVPVECFDDAQTIAKDTLAAVHKARQGRVKA